ncbi:MAG: DUF4954 family protein [Anaerohalosphaeraceae bacterium]|nr:DUF4954 family protein [Anaerohalosphaeraceae bacterium]
MDNVTIFPGGSLGYNFLGPESIPKGSDEYYLRNAQLGDSAGRWRNLRSDEIELLRKNDNTSDNWQNVLVSQTDGQFDPALIRGCEFFGLVRIGRLQNVVLSHHDFKIPAGLSDSRIIACDIGDDVAIHNVRYLAHYIIGDRCILTNIDEMHTTNHARFGNGIIKDGQPESDRIWMDLTNEIGSRKVMPFDGMITADAYLWSKYRDDLPLQNKLTEITQNSFDTRLGHYGTVACQCVIKSCRIVKDAKIGPHCYIKGANKLKNLTINSSESEPAQIGEGVELVNGIIGFGCKIFYGCKAVRFIMGNNSNLKYGARLLHSFMGDNSTVSCCEILNSLIFPAHEQHHNNSFLVAAVVMGQSNIAAGATIGSNHNSRSNDNEIQAGRGFWPGLCTSLKHSSRFASFVLLAKSAFPAELDIPLPFSLVSNNASADRLEIRPAFWWLHNMYALARNGWKYNNRDIRKTKTQNIEFDFLAPDTIEEIIAARNLIELSIAKAYAIDNGGALSNKSDSELAQIGRHLLAGPSEKISHLEILAQDMEKSRRKVVIFGVARAYEAYGQMLHYYAVKNLIKYLRANPTATFDSMVQALAGRRQSNWINLGGQLAVESDVDALRADIVSGKLVSWQDIHDRYQSLWASYNLQKQRHSFAVLCDSLAVASLTAGQWQSALDKVVEIQQLICDQVYASRKKDYDNPFRQATYRNVDEMNSALGTIDDDSFVKQIAKETKAFRKTIEEIKKRI